MERVWLATVYPVQVGAAGGVYTVARAVLTDLTRAAKRPTRLPAFALKLTMTALLFAASMHPLTDVDPSGRGRAAKFSVAQFEAAGVWHVFSEAYSTVQDKSLTNSYGLFRRMTGVEARPEVVLEASGDMLSWQEVNFRYKPGDPYRELPVIAPHQPRLDWQMWFAALGSYHHVWNRDGQPALVLPSYHPRITRVPPSYPQLSILA